MGGLQCSNSTYKESAKDSWQKTWDKNKHYNLVHLIKAGVIRPDKPIAKESMSAIAMAWGREEMEVTANGYGVSLGMIKIFLKFNTGDGCTTL